LQYRPGSGSTSTGNSRINDLNARVLFLVDVKERIQRGCFATGGPPGKYFELLFARSMRSERRLHQGEQGCERNDGGTKTHYEMHDFLNYILELIYRFEC
jgi:hypothetical protein